MMLKMWKRSLCECLKKETLLATCGMSYVEHFMHNFWNNLCQIQNNFKHNAVMGTVKSTSQGRVKK